MPKRSLAILTLSATLLSACGSRNALPLTPLPQSRVSQTPLRAATPQPTPSQPPSAAPSLRPAPTPRPSASPTLRPSPPAAPVRPPAATQGGKVLEIRLYASYGSEQAVQIKGRVMKPEAAAPPTADDSAWTNFWRNVKNMAVSEVKGVRVRLSLNGQSTVLTSDGEGMLLGVAPFGRLAPGTQTLTAEMLPGQGYSAPTVTAPVYIHPLQEPSLGVVSDIDDTIKISNVSNKLSAASKLLLDNPYSWEAMPGTARLYQLLEPHLEQPGQNDGDIVYLSGSPLNLAPAMGLFLQLQGFPAGAVELKKWGFQEGDDHPLQQEAYKLAKLNALFQAYPARQFLLFGDSSEKDAEIYRQIQERFPGQVRAIFINNVTASSASEARFANVHLTAHAGEAAVILESMGLLSAAERAEVQAAAAN